MNVGCWHSKTLALAKSIISYLWVSYFTFVYSVKRCYLQTKTHAVTSSERAHSITWYKQKRRRNRWASYMLISAMNIYIILFSAGQHIVSNSSRMHHLSSLFSKFSLQFQTIVSNSVKMQQSPSLFFTFPGEIGLRYITRACLAVRSHCDTENYVNKTHLRQLNNVNIDCVYDIVHSF